MTTDRDRLAYLFQWYVQIISEWTKGTPAQVVAVLVEYANKKKGDHYPINWNFNEISAEQLERLNQATRAWAMENLKLTLPNP